ncbi:MAG TPA: ATP-binding cassette domain-containing protein, partial [Acidiphilium sp.]|nr:ATP-binding cassette domain-containing protein [Acidiphilium sp.]
RSVGIDHRRVSEALAHDGFPDIGENWFGPKSTEPCYYLQESMLQIAEFLVLSNNYFIERSRPDQSGKIIIPKKMHKLINWAGSLKIALVWLAALMVIHGKFTVGMLIAFSTYASQFTSRADGLIGAWIDLKMLRLYGERLADIVLTPPEQNLESLYDGPTPEPTLELRNVRFRYAAGEPWILRHCSLTVPAGQALAIIGPSGAGKTTLAKLMLGLLLPTEGEILFGGMDIRRLGLKAYRAMVAAVMQDDQLFAGSIADNISLFAPDAEQKAIEAAASLAGIHDEIAAMPMGYRSLVGDMGSSLSGGQKQRVVLARALYRAPKLLVLDEATSHLDVARERQVADAIAHLAITRIIIAHRPETIAAADAICLLTGATTRLLDREAFWRPRSGDADATTAYRGSSENEDLEHA